MSIPKELPIVDMVVSSNLYSSDRSFVCVRASSISFVLLRRALSLRWLCHCGDAYNFLA